MNLFPLVRVQVLKVDKHKYVKVPAGRPCCSVTRGQHHCRPLLQGRCVEGWSPPRTILAEAWYLPQVNLEGAPVGLQIAYHGFHQMRREDRLDTYNNAYVSFHAADPGIPLRCPWRVSCHPTFILSHTASVKC